MSEDWTETLAEQKNYYDARAGEYDEFWFRRGRYALEEPLASQWDADAADTMTYIADRARGDVLELACGTGIFTDLLRRVATSVHAVDASPAMLELNRARTEGASNVRYSQHDLFAWRPSDSYDVVFFAFWLSHVPDDLFGRFWEMVRGALKPGGEVVFVDSVPQPDDAKAATDVRVEQRTLNDGRAFRIVKRYWEPDTLTNVLQQDRWAAHVEASEHRLMVRGSATPL